MGNIAVRQLHINSPHNHIAIRQVAYLQGLVSGRRVEWLDLMDALFEPNTSIFGAYFTDTPTAANGLPLMGTMTLIKQVTQAGLHYEVHDVAVHESARRAGVAETLMLTAMQTAMDRGARYIDLTSKPERVAANCLYQKLGFELRETNNYRMMLSA